jgi:hypothetical protein
MKANDFAVSTTSPAPPRSSSWRSAWTGGAASQVAVRRTLALPRTGPRPAANPPAQLPSHLVVEDRRGTNSSRLACSRGMLCQICTYRGYMRRGGGLARSLLCADESPRPGRHAAWAGHFDGEVSHLTIDEEPSGPGGRFIRVAGQISIATAPGSPRTSDAELLDTVALAAAIDVRPTSRDLHWDTTRLDKEQQSWSWLNP